MTDLPTFRRSYSLYVAVILLCALGAFLPVVRGYFVADDFVLLSWTHSHSLGALPGFFDPQTFWFYRPFVKLFYWLGQTVFGLHATPFHLFSLLVHGVNGYLIYRVVQAEGSWIAGLGAALLFLLNPHSVETVSWIAAAGDLAGVACILGALLLFRHYCAQHKLPLLLCSLVLFAIGLLWRETVVMLPVLLVIDIVVFERYKVLSARRLGLAFTAYVALLAAYLLVQGIGRSGEQAASRGGLAFHPLNLDSVLLGILAYVHSLVPGGGILGGLPLDTLRVMVWVEWMVILLIALLLWRFKQRLALFGLLWMLVTPLLFVFFSPPTDRYFYLPTAGYAIFVAALLTRGAELLQKLPLPGRVGFARSLIGVLFAVLLLWQGVGLLQKVSVWKAAGDATGGVFHDVQQAVPDPHDYSGFYLTGLPDVINGVPVFQNSLPQAIQLIYDNTTIDARSLTCDALQQVELPRYNFLFNYKANGAQQFSNKGDCR